MIANTWLNRICRYSFRISLDWWVGCRLIMSQQFHKRLAKTTPGSVSGSVGGIRRVGSWGVLQKQRALRHLRLTQEPQAALQDPGEEPAFGLKALEAGREPQQAATPFLGRTLGHRRCRRAAWRGSLWLSNRSEER